jgi:hypothetical protein
MAGTITFTLKLDKTGHPGNAARLWLDASHDDVIQSGEEITLATLDGKLWLADTTLSGATNGMQFLLKFIAPVGTTWSFTASASGASLFDSGSQRTTTLKEALAGRLS